MGNGMVHEAFQYQRQRRNTSNASDMMQYFYDRAEKLGKLDSVLQMSLMLVEERELVDFLQRSDRPSSQEVLLMYYLQRSRYSEAVALNEQLDSRQQSGRNSNNNNASTRRAIMERFSRANLFQNPKSGFSLADRLKLKRPNSGGAPAVVPLSLEVHRHAGLFNPLLHASSIRDEMERQRRQQQAGEGLGLPAEAAPGAAPFTPFRSRVQQQRRAAAAAASLVEPDIFAASAQKRKFSEVPEVVFPEDVSVAESEAAAAASPMFPSGAKRSRRTMMEDLPDLSPAGRERIARFKSRKESILSILQTPKVVKKKKQGRM